MTRNRVFSATCKSVPLTTTRFVREQRHMKLLAHEQCQAWEQEMSGGIINYVHLAGIEAGFQIGQRDIELEESGVAIGHGNFFGFDQWSLVGFGLSMEESNVSEDVDCVFAVHSFRICGRDAYRRSACGLAASSGSAGWIIGCCGRAVAVVGRIVNLVIEIKGLALGKYMGYVLDHLLSVANHPII